MRTPQKKLSGLVKYEDWRCLISNTENTLWAPSRGEARCSPWGLEGFLDEPGWELAWKSRRVGGAQSTAPSEGRWAGPAPLCPATSTSATLASSPSAFTLWGLLASFPQPPAPAPRSPLGEIQGVGMQTRLGTRTLPFLFEAGVSSLSGNDHPGPGCSPAPCLLPSHTRQSPEAPRPFGWGR